jgi:hypothetical protein
MDTAETINTGNMIGSGRGLNTPARPSEVSKEMARLDMGMGELTKLSEELIQRLASVLSPRPIPPENERKETQDLNPTTPLADSLHNVGNRMLAIEKSLRFILDSLEL